MPREVFSMRVTSSVRLRGPVITDAASASIAKEVERTVKGRISTPLNMRDANPKPLSRGYAIWKSKAIKGNQTFSYMRPWTQAYKLYDARKRHAGGRLTFTQFKDQTSARQRRSLWKTVANPRMGQGVRRPVRDLFLSGEMLANLSIRKANTKQVVYGLTARGPRMKAIANAKKEEWLGFSPRNERDVMKEAATQIAHRVPQLVKPYKP